MSMSPGGPSGAGSASMYGFTSPATLAGRSQFNQSFMSSASAAPSSAIDDSITPQMRDRQARGKDPYESGDGSDEGNLSDRESTSRAGLRLGNGRVEKEDFSVVERRQKAIAFLDNPELLMMYAQSIGESIPAARLHFTKLLCGFDEEGLEHTAVYSGPSHSRRDHYHSTDTPRKARDTRAGGN